jgi:hypothetical protein
MIHLAQFEPILPVLLLEFVTHGVVNVEQVYIIEYSCFSMLINMRLVYLF